MFPIALISALAFAATTPKSHLIVSPCEFGESYQHSTVQCAISLQNTGDKPIALSGMRAVRPEDRIGPASLIVPPKGTVYLDTHVALLNSIGRTRRYFQFTTDEDGRPKRNAEVVGYVSSVLDDARPVLEFGVFRTNDSSPKKYVQLASRETNDLRITRVLSKPDYVDVQIGEDGRSVGAAIRQDAPWGLHHGDYIKVAINAKQQAEAWISLKVDVHGEVVPDSNPLALGLMRQGSKNEFLLQLRNDDGKPFRIGDIEVEKIHAKVDPIECIPASTGCKTLRLRLDEKQATGEVGGVVTVDLPDFGKKLPIYVWGMLVGPNTEVRDLDEEIKKSEAVRANAGQSSAAPAVAKLDISKALGQAVDAPPPPPTGVGPLVKWTVAHESPVHGYAIYRADDEAGPYRRVNEKTILALGDREGGSPATYQWRDTTTVPGRTYWYYIGTLLKDGSKDKLTSPQKVVAKDQ
jgi:hypothetical protein